MLLRARAVLPISRPPIEDGAVLLADERIAAVGRWAELSPRHSGEVVDLGDTILLPGLVNAHCHLDYTDMAGQIAPTRSFTDWIKAIISLKAGWGYGEFAQSWLNGAAMLARSGVTTVLDIESVPELLPELWSSRPLRFFSCLELISIRNRASAAAQLQGAAETIAGWGATAAGVGLSPHAPYSTSSELRRLAAETARQHRWPLTTHVAESAEEFEMFLYQRGPMFEWLRGQRDLADCGHGSPVQLLAREGLLAENFLAVHANYLWAGDAQLLGQHGASVVHCPRSHDYFRHQHFPLETLRAAGVNLCLGTDSLASVGKSSEPPVLDMFAEMRLLAARSSSLAPEFILRMATVNGARALGRAGEIGELTPGALADLIAVPFAGPGADVYEMALQHRGAVSAALVGGKWVVVPALKK